jgi:hypothetical protein
MRPDLHGRLKRGLHSLYCSVRRMIGIEALTLVLCAIGVFQYWAFVISERAFVSADPEGVKFAQEILPNVPQFQMTLELNNNGKSPATIEDLRVLISHGPLPEKPDYGADPKDRFAFPPIVPNGKAKRALSFDIGKTGWVESTAMGVKSGTLKFYFYGRVRYHDDYSWRRLFRPRETGFCFIYAPNYPGGPAFDTCSHPEYTYAQ